MDLVEGLLAALGIWSIIERALKAHRVWTGIHWGGKDTERPGWWAFRPAPEEREYRRISRDQAGVE